MGRKPKITVEEKVLVCEKCIKGEKGINEAAREIGVSHGTLRRWINQYQANGSVVFIPKAHNAKYSKEFKQEVVETYLDGEKSIEAIAIKYNIPAHETVRKWIIQYNNLEILKDYNPKPEVYMKERNRKTTQEERIEIVKHCLAHDKNYKESAEIFDVSYTQVYQWVKKYLDSGEEGLTDRRGKRKEEEKLSETELLQRRVKILERQLREKEMENELLKKVQEIERRRSFPERKAKRNI